MKKKNIAFIIMQIVALLINVSILHAWTGDTWGTISRETIIRIADEMVDFSWTPAMNISNQCSLDNPRWPYNAGTIYHGEAYNRYNDPVDNWAEFYPKVNSVSCQYPPCLTSYGNECSGFVSIAWKLPERYNTTKFETDATTDGGYVIKLGEKSTGNKIEGLLPGDALVKSGSHMILFESYLYDGSGNKTGIRVMEQTPYMARHWNWIWSQLSSYRPIRRNKIDEDNYVFIKKWGSSGTSNGLFNFPWGIAVDSSGNVYVADASDDRIQKFNSNGGFITKWGSYGSGNGQFIGPWGIAVDSSGNVYVVDSENNRIQKFTSSGSFITKWTGGYFPVGAAVDSSINVYVVDQTRENIQKYSSTGSFITEWGSYGSGNGQFKDPWGIAVDSSGNVYVADSENNRIQKFNSSGTFITEWGGCCSPDGYFDYPVGIAIDLSGNVYVADFSNHRIQKFDSNGNFITKWGSWGLWDENGKFQYPGGVAVDSSLNVYVADSGNDRIQKFSPLSPYPSSPSNLIATAISSSQIYLSWRDNSNNETGFTIRRKAGINGAYTNIAVGPNVTAYTDIGLTPGVTYYYAVFASNGATIDSAYSDEVGTTPTIPTLPVKLGGTYYSTLQAAYNAAPAGAVIQSQTTQLSETLNINRNISITIDGGYDLNFTTITGETKIKGMVTLSSGKITVRNLRVAK